MADQEVWKELLKATHVAETMLKDLSLSKKENESRHAKLDAKIDQLSGSLNDHKIELERTTQKLHHYDENIRRFWDDRWPELVALQKDHETRIRTLEASAVKMGVIASIAGFIAAMAVSLVAKFILK